MQLAARYRLRVVDDGAGISESDSDGMGLDIMRYRARLIGGQLTIKHTKRPRHNSFVHRQNRFSGGR